MTQKPITDFSGPNHFLSNMCLGGIEYQGLGYRCVEAAFQAAKCLNPKMKQEFTNLDGYRARKLGKQIAIRSDWDAVRVEIMRELIAIKFHNPLMRRALLRTGNCELIEGNDWGDRFWGVCRGYGENQLGKLLMERRAVFQVLDMLL